MIHCIFKKPIGTVDMQLVDTVNSYNCKGFCDKSYKRGPKVIVTYNFPHGDKDTRVLCVNCAKAGVEDANKYGYLIGNYDNRIDDVCIENK
jgi:hypothetical protein